MKSDSFLLLFTLAAMMALTSMSVDIYLSSMPQVAAQFHAPAELTLTGFLIGFALGQLIWGPISDLLGRKLPLTLGMIIFVLGCWGCSQSQSMETLVAWRVLMALGACTAPMLARAMVRDLFAPSKAADVFLLLNIIVAIAPICGPLLGTLISDWFSWRAIFIFLMGVGSIFFLLSFKLPETLKQRRPLSSLGQSFVSYLHLWSNFTYGRYVLCITFTYVATYAFISGAPQVYISHYQQSAFTFNLIFALGVLAVLLTSLGARKIIHQYPLEKILLLATLWACFWGLMLLLADTFTLGIWYLAFCNIMHFMPTGIITSVATSLALAQVKDQQVGTATALLTALQYGSGIISSLFLAKFLSNAHIEAFALIICIALFLALVVLLPSKAHSKQNQESY
ncbi:multidrug effflux MFS transporter [Psittacicella gerlachiana]|uniref:Bcr/CflA family efflux transporter n=1 Tax=Psittacicella gerlachiana TaxID=2028574 RepID=A0A3A1YB68_9GAMM|nr:multidrug effflux MFS transporter [Psittacicella gerlachiana]RIY34418.1 hypothetical protein CKF59_05480 [Psittacicella gerlachiana]